MPPSFKRSDVLPLRESEKGRDFFQLAHFHLGRLDERIQIPGSQGGSQPRESLGIVVLRQNGVHCRLDIVGIFSPGGNKMRTGQENIAGPQNGAQEASRRQRIKIRNQAEKGDYSGKLVFHAVKPIFQKWDLGQIANEASSMTGTGLDQPFHRFQNKVVTDIDGGENDLAPIGFEVRKKPLLLKPRAAAKPHEPSFLSLEPIRYSGESVVVNAGKLGIGVNGRMFEKNLPPKLGLMRRDVEKLRVDPVGLQ